MTQKINIIIIGCGNIGRRHLESILNLDLKIDVILIEKNKKKLNDIRKQNYFFNNKKIKIFFYQDIINFNLDFYFGIISTNSNDRLKCTKKLLKYNNVKNLLLEKLLAPNINQLNSLKEYLKNKSINVYVNTPRRQMKIYKEIKKQLNLKNPINIEYRGNKWNFASNAIHFIDLFSYLANDYNIKCVSLRLSKKLSSKRNKYSEFLGYSFFVNNTKGTLFLSDSIKNQDNFSNILKINNLKYSFIIDENLGYYLKVNNDLDKIITKRNFKFELQSKITEKYIKNLKKGKKSELTDFKESYLQHHIFYQKFFYQVQKNKYKNIKIS